MQGCSRVAGIDEAGRGPLAGPVVAACCVLPTSGSIPPVNDSKQLSPEERLSLFHQILSSPIEYGVGFAEPVEIDRHNILRASFLAMSRALAALKPPPDFILIDGSLAPSFGIPTQPIVKGDSRSPSIAAASIIAKVTRDRLMDELDSLYPQYGFKHHKGYATPEHLKALAQYGPCAIHRKSFEPVQAYFVEAQQTDLF